MFPSILTTMMLIGLLGIGSQWVSWRYRMPAIVVMSITGLIVGPFLGIINPEEDFGNLYDPIISVAVAIILFEGSLHLKFQELRGLGKPLFRIATLGRSEEHTSELQSRGHLVCRLLLENKKYNTT